MKAPNILVGTTINKIKEYALFDYLNIITNLNYPNYDIYLVDNSKDEEFHKEIKSYGLDCDYTPPRGRNSREFMAEGQNMIRQRVLSRGYDAYMSIECDLYPPLDVIEYLMIHNKPVTAYPYFIYTGEESLLMLQNIEDDVNGERETRNLGFMESFCEMNGKLRHTYACGLGCALIKRRVLEKIEFRSGSLSEGHADSFFY